MSRKALFTWLAWSVLLLNVFLLFVVPVNVEGSFFGYMWLSLLVVVSWLAYVYRPFLQTWAGWFLALVPIVLVVFGMTANWLPLSPRLSLFLSTLLFPSLWLMVLATSFLLWRHDMGLAFIGCISLLNIWSVFLFWRYEGNLFSILLNRLNNLTAYNPLWWLNTLFCLSACIIPIAIASFLIHTICLLRREFQTG